MCGGGAVGDVVVVWWVMWCWYFSCIKLPLAVVVLWLLYIKKIRNLPGVVVVVVWWWCGGGGAIILPIIITP